MVSFLISFRLKGIEYKVLEEITKKLNLESPSKTAKVIVMNIIHEFIEKGDLDPKLRMVALRRKLKLYRKEEEEWLKNWKSFLRSHAKAYLLRDLKRKGDNIPRIEVIRRLITEQPEIKDAVLALLSERYNISEKMRKVLEEWKKCQEELGYFKNLNELEQCFYITIKENDITLEGDNAKGDDNIDRDDNNM